MNGRIILKFLVQLICAIDIGNQWLKYWKKTYIINISIFFFLLKASKTFFQPVFLKLFSTAFQCWWWISFPKGNAICSPCLVEEGFMRWTWARRVYILLKAKAISTLSLSSYVALLSTNFSYFRLTSSF